MNSQNKLNRPHISEPHLPNNPELFSLWPHSMLSSCIDFSLIRHRSEPVYGSSGLQLLNEVCGLWAFFLLVTVSGVLSGGPICSSGGVHRKNQASLASQHQIMTYRMRYTSSYTFLESSSIWTSGFYHVIGLCRNEDTWNNLHFSNF